MSDKHLEELIEAANNPSRRLLIAIVCDCSGSMGGAKIDLVNQGIIDVRTTVSADSVAARSVELALVGCGGDAPTVISDFVGVDLFNPSTLVASGQTPLAQSVNIGLDLAENRKAALKAAGIPYYRPWILALTDGYPVGRGETSDFIRHVQERMVTAQYQKKVVGLMVGTEDADMSVLRGFSVPERPPVRLVGLKFSGLFQALSASAVAAANSQPGAQIALPSINGWGTVSAGTV